MRTAHSLSTFAEVPEADKITLVANASIAAGKFVYIKENTASVTYANVGLADSGSSSTSSGQLYYLLAGSTFDSAYPSRATCIGCTQFRLTGVNTSTATSVNAPVYLSTSGAYTFTPGTRSRIVGTVEKVSSTDGVIFINLRTVVAKPNEFMVADGTEVTGNVETNLGSKTFSANALIPGEYIFRYSGITTGQNSTDTLTIKAKLGGTAFYTSAAVDQEVNDVFRGEFLITVRSGPAAGTTIVVDGIGTTADASPTATQVVSKLTVDTTASVVLAVTGTWSSTNAANITKLLTFSVTYR
jgi:hypothetical protein